MPGLVGRVTRPICQLQANAAATAAMSAMPGAAICRFRAREDAGLLRRIQKVPDLDPADIENLLLDGARRRGMTVDAYRDLIQAITNRTKAPFGKTLQVIDNFETSYPRDHQAVVEQIEQLAFLREGAARLGVSVRKFLTILFDDEDEELSA